MEHDRDVAARAFWEAFCRVNTDVTPETRYEVWHFGDSPDLADELYPLVLRGVKRATAMLLWECESESEPEAMPMVDGYNIVTDFAGTPQCVIQTTDVQVKPF